MTVFGPMFHNRSLQEASMLFDPSSSWGRIGACAVSALFLAQALLIVACSNGSDAPEAGAEAPAAATVVNAPVYRGPAVVTGKGDLVACPRKSDLDQFHNDMANLRVDPGDPGYGVAKAYDLHNRQCIELKAGEQLDIEADDNAAETLVRPTGETRTFWTAANWTRTEALRNRPGNGALQSRRRNPAPSSH